MISRPWKFLLSLVTQKENSIPTQIRMQDKYYRTMDSTSRWLTVETNCLSLVQGFMSLPNLEDIQMLSHNFASLSFSHVKRESNVVAHATSRLADPNTWTQDAPHSIKIVAFSSKAL